MGFRLSHSPGVVGDLEGYRTMLGDGTEGLVAAGIDVGASLIKVAGQLDSGGQLLRSIPSHETRRLTEVLRRIPSLRIGLTGAGAYPLRKNFGKESVHVEEFRAWDRGARNLLEESRQTSWPLLLVSLGTGTSVLRLDRAGYERVGGTALGGGTLLGLGRGLLGEEDFEALVRLARAGERQTVDLSVGDIYGSRGVREIGLPGEVTAANLGKLGELGKDRREDIAAAVMGLIGENVALIVAGLSRSHAAAEVVYAGSTLRGNDPLAAVLTRVTEALGCRTRVLAKGEYAGALGALDFATT